MTVAPFEHHVTSTLQVSPTTPKPDLQHVLWLPSHTKPESRKAHSDSNTARKSHTASTGFDQCRRTSQCSQTSGPATRESSESSALCSGGCSQAQSAASSAQLPPCPARPALDRLAPKGGSPPAKQIPVLSCHNSKALQD